MRELTIHALGSGLPHFTLFWQHAFPLHQHRNHLVQDVKQGTNSLLVENNIIIREPKKKNQDIPKKKTSKSPQNFVFRSAVTWVLPRKHIQQKILTFIGIFAL
jgi:hypothetical protein